MLISLQEIAKFHTIENVLHIGAHLGEEAAEYYKHGVKRSLWIEANTDLLPNLQANLANYRNTQILNAILSNVDDQDVLFNISNNTMSSSILELEHHKIAHPEVNYIDARHAKSITLNKLFLENNISYNLYDFVNIDIQGAELMFLEGATMILPYVKCISVEVNYKELYRGCPLVSDIDKFLRRFNFLRVQTKWYGDTGWGDAIYIKKKSNKVYNNKIKVYNLLDLFYSNLTICYRYIRQFIRK